MSVLKNLWHWRRWKDLYDASQALRRNWRSPMGKYLQREFLLPVFSVLAVAVAQLMGYELDETQKAVVAGMCATGVTGIIVRKSILGPSAGLAKLGEREFWLPVVGELIPFADRIFELGMTPETQIWLAGILAGMVAGLLGRKRALKNKENNAPV